MDPGMTIGIIGICSLLVVNIVGVAYGYGKLTQKVKGIDTRVERIESNLNNRLALSNPGKKKRRGEKK